MHRIRGLFTAGLLFISGLLFTAAACGALLSPIPASVPTAIPSLAASVPTQTSLPLYQEVSLNSVPFTEQGQPFSYTITAQTPRLVGSDDARVQKFNDEVFAIAQEAIAEFKANLAGLQPTPASTASSFDLRYNVLSPPGNILSIQFQIASYYTGAAHPSEISRTLTYDLERGADLNLADLFVPDSDYLTPISRYCVDQLMTRDISFEGFELGATATLNNYRNWNITSDGLMITFDEYQVAPYAAGPQRVMIPFKALSAFIQPNGILAPYLN